MKVLYITNGMSSTLNSSLELSRRLRSAGHEVVYLSPAAVGDTVRAHGYSFTELVADRTFTTGQPTVPLGMERVLSPVKWWSGLVKRRQWRRDSMANDEIEHKVKELDADLLLIDIEMHFAILATANLGLPTLLPIVWYSIFRNPRVPPLHSLLPLPSGWLDQLRVRATWWKLRLSNLHMEWRQRLARWASGNVYLPVPYDTFAIDDLRELASSRGLSLKERTSRTDWLRPLLYRELPVLCFNAQEMDFPQPVPPQLHYVGPMVLQERREAQLDASSLKTWKSYLERCEAQPQRRPMVYCSLGTYWSADQRFLLKVIEVFSRRSQWDLVLGLGGRLQAEQLEPFGENVFVLNFAPQLEVLARADCALTHGGITTINECIECGVPMVVYSTGHVDQNGCAVRLVHHGLGVLGDRGVDDSHAIEAKIEAVFQDSDLEQRVLNMRQVFAQYREQDLAVQTIERAARSC